MITDPSTVIGSVFRSSARWAAVTVVLVGAVAAVIRMSGPAWLIRALVAGVRVDTSLLFVLSGASLWLGVDASPIRNRLGSQACGVAVAVVGLAVFSDYLIAPGITWADGSRGVLPALSVGRMAPTTAFCFCLVGLALTLLDLENHNGRRPAQFLTAGVAFIALLAFIGYLYGFEPFRRLVGADPMPLHVALTFMVLCAGILSARPDRGITSIAASDTAGGLLVRWLPAAVFGVPLLFGWLTLSGQRAGFYELEFGISIFVILNTAFFSVLILRTASSLDRTDQRRTRAEDELKRRASQQAGVAELSQRALSGVDCTTLMNEAVGLIAETLEASQCELLEYDPEDGSLRLEASVGWKKDMCGHEVAHASIQQMYGYTLACKEPIVVTDLRTDSRFASPPVRLAEVVSGLSVVVLGRMGPSGLLAAYTRTRRTFTRDDILFVQTIAAVLATAADRKRTDAALRLSEEKFASVFRSCPDPILVSTLSDRRFIDVNESFLRMAGYRRDEVIGQTAVELNFWVEQGLPAGVIDETQESGTLSNREISFRTKTGEVRIGLIAAEIIQLDGEPCMLAAVRDISERKRAEGETRETNEKLARWVNELESRGRETTLINEMGDLLQSCLTPPEAYGIVGQYAQQLFQGDAGALCMLNGTGDLLEAVAAWGEVPQDAMVFSPHECWALRRGRLHRVSDPANGLVCPHLTRTPRGAYMCVPMMAQGEALGVLHLREIAPAATDVDLGADDADDPRRRLVVTVAEHIALALANLRLRETLRTQSIRDQLTGLFNRRYMEESLERELRRAARTRRRVGVILLDLDRFKDINDTYGHEAGDKVLRAIGQFLQGRTREEDIACRYGGEEFVFVLPEASLESTRLRAEQLREEVKLVRVQHRGRDLPTVTLSLGVAVYPDHGQTASKLLRTADAALYRAKADGRDRLVVGVVRSRSD